MLWVGTQGEGVSRFDPRTKQFTVYRHKSDDPQSLSNDRVSAIREDRHGRLWIGTDNGLNLLDRNRGTVTVFTTREGLPDNTIRSILEDGRVSVAGHTQWAQPIRPADENLPQLFRIGWSRRQFFEPICI